MTRSRALAFALGIGSLASCSNGPSQWNDSDASVAQGDGGGGNASDGGPSPFADLGHLDSGIPNPCPANQTLPALSGRVLAPNGQDPVAGALVYVPHGEPQALGKGNQCELCKTPSSGVWAVARTDAEGRFTLRQTPVGEIKLVVQHGYFRRIATVTASCGKDTVVPPEATRLPRKRAEGDLPRIAVATGIVDRMQDVLSKIGIEEFDLFDGKEGSSSGGTAMPKVSAILSDPAKLAEYNIVLFNCRNGYEGSLQSGTWGKNLEAFVRSGGRLFVDDMAYEVVEWSFPLAVDFETGAAAATGGTPQGPANAAERGEYAASLAANIPDPDLKRWLSQFPNTLRPDGTIPITGWLSNWAVMHGAAAGTKVWVEGNVSFKGGSGARPLSVSFDADLGGGKKCGRVVYNSYHTVPYNSSPSAPFVPQERILEYLFFHLADCGSLR
ncbi:MAG: carboxypeptidase regulatory-like domain-containing protein [Deltaproteobacteria bacterium]|nr:carboxypeptidase regulatory-like domain-containing protein [Deltaproteobacteria bacterium]